MNPLLLGPSLVLRALDDLHAIAEAARSMPDHVGALEARLEHIEDRFEEVSDLGERIEQRAGEIIVLGGTLQQLAGEVLEEARVMAVRAQAVADVGTQVVASLPALERAVTMATPLEGAVERVGRLVDRLPGGRHGPPAERPSERDR